MTMLDRMRRHKNWLKWSLVIVVLTFVAFYIPDFLRPADPATRATAREVVAEVDGHELTAGEFRSRYERQLQSYRQQFGGSVNEALLRQLRVEQRVLTEMIEEQVAVLEAQRKDIRVSDEELAQQILAFPVFNDGKGGFIGQTQYRQILQSNIPPLTVSEFEEGLRRGLLVDKLRAALTDWMSISDKELEKAYRERNEKVKLQVVTLTADKFRDKVNVTDADVATYFSSHSADYKIGEQRKVKYLLLDAEQARTRVNASQSEIQKFYNDNLERFRTPEQIRASHILLKTEGKEEAKVRAQADDVLKQLKGGADFATLAKKYSEDDGSKVNGGDLDYFSRGRMVPEFEKVAFELPVGQTSEVVKSQFGFHIIKVVDKKPEVTRPLEEVRNEIQQQLVVQKANDLVAKQAVDMKIASLADMEKAASGAGVKVQESDLFTREKPVGLLGVAPDVSGRAFELKDGEAAGPLTSPRGPVFIVLSAKKDSYVPMLSEVHDRVRNDVIREKAAELSRSRAREIAAALASSSDFAAAAKAQGLEAKDTQLQPRNSSLPDVGINAEVDKAAFALPVGGTSAPIAIPDATVIVRVTEHENVKPEELAKTREAFRAELLEERRNKFFSAYMSKVKEAQQKNIHINVDVMQRLVSNDSL